jgi:ribosomal protein S12 methylthiotransferase accessory factor
MNETAARRDEDFGYYVVRSNDFELDEAVEAWIAKWVNPRYGLIRNIVNIPYTAGMPRLNRVVSSCGDQYRARPATSAEPGAGRRSGLGVSFNISRACWSSIGEALERYAAGLYYEDELVMDTAEGLGAAAAHTEELILSQEAFAPTHLHYKPYFATEKRHWTPANRISDNSVSYMPAQLVWFGYESAAPAERIGLISSNGLAAGRNRAAASCTGVLEAIERDALMCHWFLGIRPPHIEHRDLMRKIMPEEAVDNLERRSVEINVVLLKNEFGVPVVFALFVDEKIGVLGVGAGSSLDPVVAAGKAVHEALMVYMDQASKQIAGNAPAQIDKIARFSDHVDSFRDRSRWGSLAFLREHDEVINIRDCATDLTPHHDARPAEKLSRICHRLRDFGYESLEIDMTRDDICEAGFYVTRVMVPGLQPLLIGPVVPSDQRRLKSFSVRNLGHETDVRRELHPFP